MDIKAKIYGVDDTKLNREMLRSILNEYDLELFDSGIGCLNAFENTLPDLLLLDVNMPEMSGIEVCEKIRERSEYIDIPIIFLSAETSIETRLEGYAAGGDDYVTKPFDHKELLAKVKAALKRKKKLDKVSNDAKDSATMTMEIMAAMGENSTVIHFLQNMFNCNSYDSLANKIIQAHTNLGLDVAIELLR